MTFIKCGLCIVCSTGLMTNCFGIFFTPLIERFGYKMVQLTFAVSLRDLTSSFVVIFVSKLFQKVTESLNQKNHKDPIKNKRSPSFSIKDNEKDAVYLASFCCCDLC